MKIKCEYCGNYISDTDEKCNNCGAVNKNLKRVGVGVPTTIEELKTWYNDHNLPPEEVTRFFIGKDYKEKRAFGIYYDEQTKNYVVYKNKDDGTRAIRYEGKDEKYAVNELYLKLKEEIQNQKGRNLTQKSSKNHRINPMAWVLILLWIVIFIMGVLSSIEPSRGYYNINNNEYYYVDGNWYVYDNNNWNTTSEPSYSGDLDSYYDGDSYSSNSSYSDIKDSDVYDESWEHSSSSSSDSDWDSGSSWSSSDSWDSGSTDWSSDW